MHKMSQDLYDLALTGWPVAAGSPAGRRGERMPNNIFPAFPVVVCRVCPAACRDAPRAYQNSETAASVTENWRDSKGKSDPRQATPKGSRGQAYPREGSVEKAVGESAGRSYREADMRRGARDEGATQPEVLQLSKRTT